MGAWRCTAEDENGDEDGVYVFLKVNLKDKALQVMP
jgi:hypothetical protein